jgi:hypothetical protein
MHEQVENCKYILSQGQKNSNKTEKNPHAKSQVHSFTVMLIIIPVKLVYSNSSTQEQISQHNETVFTNSRAIALQILDKSTSKT